MDYIIALEKSKVNNYLLIYDKFLLNSDIRKNEENEKWDISRFISG
jgi:hypothetical protein